MTTIDIIELGIRNTIRLREELDANLKKLYAQREAALDDMSWKERMEYLGFTDVGEFIKFERERAEANVLAHMEDEDPEIPYEDEEDEL